MEVQVWLLFVPQAPLVVVEMARLILHPRALEVLSAPLKQKSCSRFLTITHLKGNLAAVACFWVVARGGMVLGGGGGMFLGGGGSMLFRGGGGILVDIERCDDMSASSGRSIPFDPG